MSTRLIQPSDSTIGGMASCFPYDYNIDAATRFRERFLRRALHHPDRISGIEIAVTTAAYDAILLQEPKVCVDETNDIYLEWCIWRLGISQERTLPPEHFAHLYNQHGDPQSKRYNRHIVTSHVLRQQLGLRVERVFEILGNALARTVPVSLVCKEVPENYFSIPPKDISSWMNEMPEEWRSHYCIPEPAKILHATEH